MDLIIEKFGDLIFYVICNLNLIYVGSLDV